MTLVGWQTEEAFYDGDTRRPPSREIDLGNRWCGHEIRPWWRVSYLAATGELIAVRLDPPGEHPVANAPAPLAVLLLGWFPSAEECEQALAGWQARQNHPNGIAWVRQQVRRKGVDAGAVSEDHRRRVAAKAAGAQGDAPPSLF